MCKNEIWKVEIYQKYFIGSVLLNYREFMIDLRINFDSQLTLHHHKSVDAYVFFFKSFRT